MAQCTETGSDFLLFRHTEPIDAEVLYSVGSWEQEDFENYVLEDKQADIRPLLAFIAMGIISLIIFLIWRFLRCCCRCCCLRSSVEEEKQQKEKTGYAMTHRQYIGAQVCKGFAILLFLGLLALTIWGLTTVDKGFTDKGYDAIDAPFDYVDEVKAEVDSAGAPLETIAQDKVPEARRIVRVNMNDDPEPSSTAFRDTLERSKTLVDSLYYNSTSPNPASTADSLEALVEGEQRQQQYIDALDSQVDGLEQSVNNVANFDSTKLPTAAEYGSLETDLDAAITNPSNANKNELRNELNTIEASTSLADISSLETSLTQINRLNLNALEGSSAEAASPPSSQDGSLQVLKENLRRLQEIATDLSVEATATGTQQGLLPFMDARLNAIGQEVVELTAKLQRAQSIVDNHNTDVAAMHSAGVDGMLNQLPESILIDPIGDSSMLDSLRDVSSRLSGDVGDILAYISAVREMLADFDPVRTALDDHDANQIDDAALQDRLRVFKDRVTAATSGQQSTNFAGFQASTDNAQQDVQTADQSYAQSVRDNLLSRRQTYEDVNQNMQQQQPPTPSAVITSIRAVAGSSFPQQEFIPVEVLITALEGFLSQTSTVEQEAANLQSQLQSVNGDVDGLLDVGPLETARDESRSDADYYNDIRYRVNMALYGLGAIFGLILLVVCLVNCPAGIGIVNVIVLLYVIFFFILATIAGAILTGARDGCVNAEALIKHEVDEDFRPLFRYYFDGEENNVKNILKEAGIVDLDGITASAEDFEGQLVNSLDPFQPTGDLKNTLTEIEAEIQQIQDNVDAVIAKFEREPVMGVYNTIKCFMCEDTFGEFSNMWYMFTFAGWLLMVMTWFANGLLGVLDKVPRANACCPCACLLHITAEPRNKEETGRREESEVEKDGFLKGSKVAPVPLDMEATGGPPDTMKAHEDMPSVTASEPAEDRQPKANSILPPIRQPSLPRN